jgi:hypothetical protein
MIKMQGGVFGAAVALDAPTATIGWSGVVRQRDPEGVAKPGKARWGDPDGAAVLDSLDPAEAEAVPRQCRTDGARQMRPPLAPVEAGPAEPPAAAGAEIHTDSFEKSDALAGDLAAVVVEFGMAALDQCVGERHAEPPGKMVVAGPPKRNAGLRSQAGR